MYAKGCMDKFKIGDIVSYYKSSDSEWPEFRKMEVLSVYDNWQGLKKELCKVRYIVSNSSHIGNFYSDTLIFSDRRKLRRKI